MADPFAQARATAARLLAAKGAPVTITRPGSAGTRDPVTQQPIAGVKPVVAKTRAVELPPGPSAQFRIGTLVGRNVKEFYLAYPMAPAGFEALEGDVVGWADGSSYTIKNVVTYKPNGGGAVLSRALCEA